MRVRMPCFVSLCDIAVGWSLLIIIIYFNPLEIENRGYPNRMAKAKRKPDEPEQTSSYTCGHYRLEMVLNGFRRRLQQEDLSEEERAALRLEIERLEREMGLD